MGIEQLLMSEVSPDQKRENYGKDASKRANEQSSFIQKILGKGLTKEDVIIADAEEENKYRELLKEGKISEEEFKCLTTIDLRKSETFNALLDRNRTVIEGVSQGHKINALEQVDTPIAGGGYYALHEVEVDGQKINPDDAATIYNELAGELEKREAILERIQGDIQ